jgi:hypothetical protein
LCAARSCDKRALIDSTSIYGKTPERSGCP